MKFKLSKYLVVIDNENILGDNIILYSTRTSNVIELKRELYNNINDINIENIPQDVLSSLVKSEIFVSAEEDELSEILNFNILKNKNEDTKVLAYTIQPSGNCQLGCHYCGQNHTNKTMSQEVLDLSYERILKKCDDLGSALQEMRITWYGGEPLTGLSSLMQLSKKLIDLAESRNLRYTSKIVTNALNLKYSLFEKLVNQCEITSYQITIDGMKEFHDKRRYLKNGNASFDIIINNIKEIVKSDLYKEKAHFNIRCNVDKENKDNVFNFIDYLNEIDVLAHVSFYVAPIHDWGDNKATIKGVSKDEFAEFEIEVYMKLFETKANLMKNIIPQRNSSPCMVVSSTSEVFDAFGNISTCWEVPYTPYYDNTDYYSGNLLKDKNITTEKAIMRNWFEEIPNNESWCKTCKFLPVCGGACPKDWYEGSPACPSFKFNIEDRILLQRFINER